MKVDFLYLDESGDTGWPSGYGGNSGQYFVYAGVILDSVQNHEAKSALTEILDDHFQGFLRTPEEVHYADAVHGNGRYDQLSADEREDLRADLFDLILDLEPTIMASVIDKVQMKERYGSDARNPKQYGFRATVDRFHKRLEEKDRVGTVTIDSAERNYDRQLRRMIYNAQDSGISLPGTRFKRDTTLPRLMDTVTMSPSEMSTGIQLADIVAYQIRAKHRYSGTTHGYDAIEHLFRDPPNANFTEPSVIPR